MVFGSNLLGRLATRLGHRHDSTFVNNVYTSRRLPNGRHNRAAMKTKSADNDVCAFHTAESTFTRFQRDICRDRIITSVCIYIYKCILHIIIMFTRTGPRNGRDLCKTVRSQVQFKSDIDVLFLRHSCRPTYRTVNPCNDDVHPVRNFYFIRSPFVFVTGRVLYFSCSVHDNIPSPRTHLLLRHVYV